MKRTALVSQLVAQLAGGVALVAACSSSSSSGFGTLGDDAGPTTVHTGPDGSMTTTIIPPSGGNDGSTMLIAGDGGGGMTTTGDSGSCNYASNDTVDHDGDGWSNADGDCNDCNKYINPGAFDIAGNGIDEDCNGKADDEPTGCDSTLTSIATTSGADGAKAIDLCRNGPPDSTPLKSKTWGVLSADYVLPDGSSNQMSNPNYQLGLGILGPKFGTSNSVQQGQHMLGLSSGTARQPTDPGYQDVAGFDKGYTSGAPTGFPGQAPACGSVQFGQPHDGAALRVVVRVPTNALTMSFDSNFFSYEFPEWVCSPYNDTYVVIMSPAPAGEPTTAHNNIAFDSMGNTISINAGFLTVCDPTTTAGEDGTGPNAGNYSYACTEGPGKLQGTGFGAGSGEDHASTDWLTTTANVAALAGQDITLLFAVWDSTDGELDTTVLVDNVTWTFATEPDQTSPPPTAPVTTPK